jgi:hypothetical protein
MLNSPPAVKASGLLLMGADVCAPRFTGAK